MYIYLHYTYYTYVHISTLTTGTRTYHTHIDTHDGELGKELKTQAPVKKL